MKNPVKTRLIGCMAFVAIAAVALPPLLLPQKDTPIVLSYVFNEPAKPYPVLISQSERPAEIPQSKLNQSVLSQTPHSAPLPNLRQPLLLDAKPVVPTIELASAATSKPMMSGNAGVTSPTENDTLPNRELANNTPTSKPPSLGNNTASTDNLDRSGKAQPLTVSLTSIEPNKKERNKSSRTQATLANNDQTVLPLSNKKKIWLRIASLTDKDNAESLVKTLKAAQYPVNKKTVTINNISYERVLVGPFTDKDSADKAVKALSKQGYSPIIQN